MSIITNLLFVIEDNKILLIWKKKGFGEGKWNGPGGKVNTGETIIESTIREIREEVGLNTYSLQDRGVLRFYFGEVKKPNFIVHIFVTNNYEGELMESEEALPKWFNFEDIPYDLMWEDDQYWLPSILEGKSVDGDFHFSDDMSKLVNYNMKVI